MGATDDVDTAFYIHTLAIADDGGLRLLEPERIIVKGEKPESVESTQPERAAY
jgi:hypothetical protein